MSVSTKDREREKRGRRREREKGTEGRKEKEKILVSKILKMEKITQGKDNVDHIIKNSRAKKN